MDDVLKIESTRHDELHVRAESEAATLQLGLLLARVLQPGSVLALVGDLGAGKTRLVKAIAQGMGVSPEDVNSPTFTLIHEYPASIPLRHCDTYRLKDPDEFLDLGLDELLSQDGVALIEWADRVSHLLPRDLLRINIQIVSPSARVFELSATGKKSLTLLDRLRKQVEA